MGLGAKYLSVMGMDFSLVTFLKRYSLLGVTGAQTTAATTSPSWPTTWRRAPWPAAGLSSHRSSGSPVPRRQHLPTTTSSSPRLSPRSGTLCVTKWVYTFQNFFKKKMVIFLHFQGPIGCQKREKNIFLKPSHTQGPTMGTVQLLYIAGLLVGSFLFGKLADRFGRKPSLLIAILLCSTSELIGSFNSFMFGIYSYSTTR